MIISLVWITTTSSQQAFCYGQQRILPKAFSGLKMGQGLSHTQEDPETWLELLSLCLFSNPCLPGSALKLEPCSQAVLSLWPLCPHFCCLLDPGSSSTEEFCKGPWAAPLPGSLPGSPAHQVVGKHVPHLCFSASALTSCTAVACPHTCFSMNPCASQE